jgi:transmembrane sensor
MERPSKNTLIRYFRGQCLPHEIELIKLYLAMDMDKALVEACMKEAWLNEEEDRQMKIGDAETTDFKKRFYARQNMLNQLPPLEDPFPSRKSMFRFQAWTKVAAAALIIISTSLFIYHKTHDAMKGEFAQQDREILPGGKKALLTLADGSVISLSDKPAGKLTSQGGLQVEKTKEGEIVYVRSKERQPVPNATNTIETPRGGQYRVTLPDGTKAWLNAASSLSYPIQFQGNERRVKMTGEVYFEVAKAIQPNSTRRIPFFVETDKQEVQVLGTHFNINAYPDEDAVKTTLLEGSVQVKARNGKFVLLKPGQQAVLTEDIRVENADTKQQLAWKNGDFIFRGETLESTLRQVARWYDVKVECPSRLGKLRFNGMVSRSQPLSMIIEMIQLTKQAKVTVKERRLIVTD